MSEPATSSFGVPEPTLPPRTSRRRAAVTVMFDLVVLGVALGALWAWIAPSVRGVVALTKSSGNRVHAYLGSESDHYFVAAFLMLGLLTVAAVVAAVLVWQWRSHRGPVMVIALTVGTVLAAAAATATGAVLGRWRFGVLDIDGAPVTPEHRVHYVTEAASVFFGNTPLQMATTLLLPAATAALVYALLAVSTTRDDLDAYPPIGWQAPRPVTSSDSRA